MSHNPKLTMIGLYNWDETIFDNLILPPEINKEDFINSFLLEYGECPVIYTDSDFMKFAIGVWSKKWYSNIERIISAMTDDYNPLYNFDRHEKYSDIEGIEGTFDNTNENKVSAYNENTYQPDNQSINGGNNTTDRELTHDGHLYGNIGVTTSQQMLEAELKLRE